MPPTRSAFSLLTALSDQDIQDIGIAAQDDPSLLEPPPISVPQQVGRGLNDALRFYGNIFESPRHIAMADYNSQQYKQSEETALMARLLPALGAAREGRKAEAQQAKELNDRMQLQSKILNDYGKIDPKTGEPIPMSAAESLKMVEHTLDRWKNPGKIIDEQPEWMKDIIVLSDATKAQWAAQQKEIAEEGRNDRFNKAQENANARTMAGIGAMYGAIDKRQTNAEKMAEQRRVESEMATDVKEFENSLNDAIGNAIDKKDMDVAETERESQLIAERFADRRAKSILSNPNSWNNVRLIDRVSHVLPEKKKLNFFGELAKKAKTSGGSAELEAYLTKILDAYSQQQSPQAAPVAADPYAISGPTRGVVY